MENFPLISIIVPIYNVEKYLAKCVQSILHQSYDNLEIILIDDGSTDTSPIICDQLSARDNRILVVHQANGGLSSARNAGLDRATGDYIGFVDSDDWIEEDMYMTLLTAAKEYNADIAICTHFVDKEKETIPVNNTGEHKIYSREEALKELFKDKLIKNYAWNKLYKKELFTNIRFPIGRFFEDIAVIYKLFNQASKVVLICESKYHYLLRHDSIIGKEMNPNKEYQYLLAVHEQLSFGIKEGLHNENDTFVLRKGLHTINHIILQKDDRLHDDIINKILVILHNYDTLGINEMGIITFLRRHLIYYHYNTYRRFYKIYRNIFKWKWVRK